MESKPARFAWLSHVLPVLVSLVALAMLVLTPVWALGFLGQPFAGMLLEPNNIVSKINGTNWPARQVGAAWPEQLISMNGQPVKDTAQVNSILARRGMAPLKLVFAKLSHFTLPAQSTSFI